MWEVLGRCLSGCLLCLGLVGVILMGISSAMGVNILIKNTNRLAAAYNKQIYDMQYKLR